MQLTIEDMGYNPCVTISASYVDIMALDGIGRDEIGQRSDFNEQGGYSEAFLLCDKQDGHRLENSEAIEVYDVLSKVEGGGLFVRIVTAGNIVVKEGK